MSVTVSLLSGSTAMAVQMYWPLSEYCADSRTTSLEPSTNEPLKMENITVTCKLSILAKKNSVAEIIFASIANLIG